MIGAMRPHGDRRNRATDYFILVLKKHLGQDKNFSILPATTSWRIRTMSNRRFEMYDYRQIIHRIRMGQTDREIARTKIIGRAKIVTLRFNQNLPGAGRRILLYRYPIFESVQFLEVSF